jgi:hypothetical protein
VFSAWKGRRDTVSRFSRGNVCANDDEKVVSAAERLFGIVLRPEAGVGVKCEVSLRPKTVEDRRQASMFLVVAARDALQAT